MSTGNVRSVRAITLKSDDRHPLPWNSADPKNTNSTMESLDSYCAPRWKIFMASAQGRRIRQRYALRGVETASLRQVAEVGNYQVVVPGARLFFAVQRGRRLLLSTDRAL
jgi:hypothetical protein